MASCHGVKNAIQCEACGKRVTIQTPFELKEAETTPCPPEEAGKKLEMNSSRTSSSNKKLKKGTTSGKWKDTTVCGANGLKRMKQEDLKPFLPPKTWNETYIPDPLMARASNTCYGERAKATRREACSRPRRRCSHQPTSVRSFFGQG